MQINLTEHELRRECANLNKELNTTLDIFDEKCGSHDPMKGDGWTVCLG